MNSLNIRKSFLIEDAKAINKLFVIFFKLAFNDLFALEIGKVVDHSCTHFSFSLDHRLEEIDKVFLVSLVELDDHAYID